MNQRFRGTFPDTGKVGGVCETCSVTAPRSALDFVHLTPIDGLRAVAAILVVLFHAEMPGFDNGFVGRRRLLRPVWVPHYFPVIAGAVTH